MHRTKFRFIGQKSFRGENFWKSTIQKQELPVVAMFLMNRDEKSILYRRHSIDPSYQMLVNLGKRFQRRRFLEIYQSETSIACDGHVS
jgi:hypothetical protein